MGKSRPVSESIPNVSDAVFAKILNALFPGYDMEKGRSNRQAFLRAIRNTDTPFERSLGDDVAKQCGTTIAFQPTETTFLFRHTLTLSSVMLTVNGRSITMEVEVDERLFNSRVVPVLDPSSAHDEEPANAELVTA